MNTHPSPSKGAAEAAKRISSMLEADADNGVYPLPINEEYVAELIDQHTGYKELVIALGKVTSWANTLHKAHGLLSNGPCANVIREAKALLAKHATP